MRWVEPTSGDTRIKSGFLFFPTGYPEVRWLEYASWMEFYNIKYGWIFKEWIYNEEEFRPS